MTIRECRQEKDLTLKEVGHRIGVAESTMCLYERGKRQVPPEKAKMLGEVFGMSIQEIWPILYERGEDDASTANDAGEGCRRVSGDQS